MMALIWHGKGDIRCESVPDPRIEHPRDAIIKVTARAICGSDLHIYDGVIPEKRATCSAMRRWARWWSDLSAGPLTSRWEAGPLDMTAALAILASGPESPLSVIRRTDAAV
jgi:hypothetical protein